MSPLRARWRGPRNAPGDADPGAPVRALRESRPLVLAPEPDAVHDARAWVVDALAGWPEPGVETARLLVSEVVTNAVLHAGTPIEVRVRTLGRASARFEVGDQLRASPLRRRFQPESATGKGLRLVEALANEWGVWPTADGKVVWFVVSSDGRRSEHAH